VARRDQVALDFETKRSRLEEWLRTKWPSAEDLSIVSMNKATGGFGSPIRFLDLHLKEGGQERTERLVIQQEPRTPPPDYNVAMQFHTMKCLYGSNVPVPRVYWLEEDPSILGTRFFITAKVEGSILDPQVPGKQPSGLLFEASPERRAGLWNGAIEAIANVNTLDWEKICRASSIPARRLCLVQEEQIRAETHFSMLGRRQTR